MPLLLAPMMSGAIHTIWRLVIVRTLHFFGSALLVTINAPAFITSHTGQRLQRLQDTFVYGTVYALCVDVVHKIRILG